MINDVGNGLAIQNLNGVLPVDRLNKLYANPIEDVLSPIELVFHKLNI